MRHPPVSRSQQGFTLVELLVTLAIAAILLVLAAPSFSTLLRNNQASGFINSYGYALRVARNEAVSSKITVTLCQSNDLQTCTGENEWQNGWMVFTDPDGNGGCGDTDDDGRCDSDDGIIVLRERPDSQDFSFAATGRPAAGVITYDRLGYAEYQQATFSLCDDRGQADPRGLTLNDSGRFRSTEIDSVQCP